MNYDSRLRRLEEQHSPGPEPMRILVEFVDPDPAVGVVSVLAIAQDIERRLFEREAGETVKQLCARAEAAVGWE